MLLFLTKFRLLPLQAAFAVCMFGISSLNAEQNILHNTSLLPESHFEVLLSKSFKYKQYVALKNINAYEIDLRSRINKYYGLYVNFESSDINFKGFDLHNKKMKILNKIALYQGKNFRITTDIGYEYNKADDVSITHNWTLNKILSTTLPDKNIKIIDDEIVYGKNGFKIYDKDGNYIQPQVDISKLYSQSFFLKTYLGYSFLNDNHLDIYLGMIKNSINGNVSFQPQSDFLSINSSDYSISRDEKIMLAGFTYMKNIYDLKVELNYEYNKFDRDIENKYNVNQLVDLVLNYSATKNLSTFFQVKYMTHQLMNHIPYSYSKLTSYSFERHYGFFKVGFLYGF